jgi:AraC family transcriptional regulator
MSKMGTMLAPYLFPHQARLGEDNVVLHARARQHRVEGFAGPVSVKTVLEGTVAWHVSGRDLVVDPASFLILGAGEKYSMRIDEWRPVETCCAFFAPGFFERTVLDATSSLATALAHPERPLKPIPPYLSSAYHDQERSLLNRVQSLAARCKVALAPSGAEEDFLLLAVELHRFVAKIREQIERVPAVRPATREELYRRLLIGRDYLHSHTSEPVSLTDAARAACLSPYHFHRAFKQAFEWTPHVYLTRLRLSQARLKLEAGAAVTEACMAAGFSSPAAFSRLYRSHYGQAPSQVRRKLRKIRQENG